MSLAEALVLTFLIGMALQVLGYIRVVTLVIGAFVLAMAFVVRYGA